MSKTLPQVFIVESLKFTDEDENYQEGDILSRILNLSNKRMTKYYYIRTKNELKKVIEIFSESSFRYLHISCHANENSMFTTLDEIAFEELGIMLNQVIDKRRIFVSACEMANQKLAKILLKDSGCYSLIGPAKAIGFADATAFWVAFYHLMFKHNKHSMIKADLKKYVKELSELFSEEIVYYSASKESPTGFRLIKF